MFTWSQIMNQSNSSVEDSPGAVRALMPVNESAQSCSNPVVRLLVLKQVVRSHRVQDCVVSLVDDKDGRSRSWQLGPRVQGCHLRGMGSRRPPKEKEKKEKRKKKTKKEKKEKKKKERKKGTMNNVKLLHIKCCFFPIFQ